MGQPIDISIPGMQTFHLPDPEKFDWEKLFDFARQHIAGIRGKVAVDRVWKRLTQDFPPEQVAAFEHALQDFINQIVDRHNHGEDTRWLPILRNSLFLERHRGKFDFVVGNPPWVRIHNIDEKLRQRIDQDYSYCQKAGWKYGCALAGIGRGFARQTDLCVPFVERAFELLVNGGGFSFVITAKIQQALYANELRRALITDKTLVRISDYSLYPLPLFEGAINYPLVLSIRNDRPERKTTLRVQITNSEKRLCEFDISQRDLSLLPEDAESPWMMAPPEVIAVLRKVQASGQLLGENPETQPRMGVKTGANDIFIVNEVGPTESPDDVMAKTEGGKVVRIEKSLLRPLVRGRDVQSWAYGVKDHIIWTHDDKTGESRDALPERAAAYFANSERLKSLVARDDYKEGMVPWTIFRTTADKLGLKVAWKKYGTEMQSVVLDQYYTSEVTGESLLVPLQTVYFIPVDSRQEALLMAGIFNSIPFKTLMMTFAVRARGAYFHYIGWIVGLGYIPLGSIKTRNDLKKDGAKPASGKTVAKIIEISELLHGSVPENKREKLQAELEHVSAEGFNLDAADLEILTKYYEFMRPPIKDADVLEEVEEEE